MNIYYVFEFNPFGKGTNIKYQTYSQNKSLVEKFIKQHQMGDGLNLIQTLDEHEWVSDPNISEYDRLQTYKFKSNRTGKVYDIISTPILVEEAYVYVASELSEACLFGEMVTKRNIPIIDSCCTAIENLDFGFILDLDDMNDEYESDISCNKHKWKTCVGSTPTEEDFYSEGPSDKIVFDTLFDEYSLSNINNKPQPITIEAYISYFVSLITDKLE